MHSYTYNVTAMLIILSFLLISPSTAAFAVEKAANYPIVEANSPPDVPIQGDDAGEIPPYLAREEVQDTDGESGDTQALQDTEDFNDGVLKKAAQSFLPEALIVAMADRGTLKVDGKFNDWTGMPNLGDPQGDSSANADLKAVYYETNDGESNLYFMIQRYRPSNMRSTVNYKLYIDINDNGIYSDSVDKYATVSFMPLFSQRGYVSVVIYRVNGAYINTYSGFWGEGTKVSERCEFKISMSNLEIIAHQPLRFYLTSNGSPIDRLPNSGDIQWAPVPAAGKLGLAALFLGGLFILIKAVRSRKQC